MISEVILLDWPLRWIGTIFCSYPRKQKSEFAAIVREAGVLLRSCKLNVYMHDTVYACAYYICSKAKVRVLARRAPGASGAC